jgi:hypothetical protein
MPFASNKVEMLVNLRAMLTDVFNLRNQGASYANLARAQGHVDGYMRSIIDAGIASERELLALVVDQRRIVDGPATKELQSETTLAA